MSKNALNCPKQCKRIASVYADSTQKMHKTSRSY